MDMQTPRNVQEYNEQQILEEKLKIHVQREFELGEKVISLLTQKKALETTLQEHLHIKEDLEKTLEETVTNKKALEQRFLQVQQELQEQKRALRRRSRKIIETEEDSQENLKTLRQEIHRLKEQLDIMDIQKVEDHIHLTNTIKELCDQENHLKQELHRISSQKKRVEEELHDTTQNFREFSIAHQQETAQYEQQIDALQRKQAVLEIRIAHLLDEQHHNEQKLQKEIESLKRSKIQLEEKVTHLKQHHTEVIHNFDAELLQVIEKQEKLIHGLKEQAHQRSTMLKAENETLKKEVEEMQTAQQKVIGEKQRLESSLQGLRDELAEYSQLKNKLEGAQKEQKHFESKKIKLPGVRQRKPYQRSSRAAQLQEKHHHVHAQKVPKKTDSSGKSKRRTNIALLIPVAMLVSILLGVVLYPRLPLRIRSIHVERSLNAPGVELLPEELELPPAEMELFPTEVEFSPAEIELPPAELELPPTELELPPAELALLNDELPLPEDTSESDIQVEKGASDSQSLQDVQVSDQPALSKAKGSLVEGSKVDEVKKSQVPEPVLEKDPEPSRPEKKNVSPPKRPVSIVVQLPSTHSDRFLPKEPTPFPTIENNVVLRRHYEKKH